MKKRKAINFDLSTNELKKHFNNTAEAYNQIKKFMLDNGFIHRQYSSYASKEAMGKKDVIKLARKLNKQFSWLSTCVQHFDVTDIGEQHDLTHLLTSNVAQKDKNIANQISLNKKDIDKALQANSTQSQNTDSKVVSMQEATKEANTQGISPSESTLSKMKQKIAEFEKSGKLDAITRKRDKGKDRGR